MILAKSQHLRSLEFIAHSGVDESADRLRLPWLHAGTDAIAQTTYLNNSGS